MARILPFKKPASKEEKAKAKAGTVRRKRRQCLSAKAKSAAKKVSRTRKPDDMTVEQWQIALRREFGREQDFDLKNLGTDPLFSEFLVRNPATGGEYRVSIRGSGLGSNFCSCPDFSVNTLGTCKHIEFALGRLERKRGAKRLLAEGFRPSFSEIHTRYGAQRKVVFRPGTECPPALLRLAKGYFDEDGVLRENAPMRFNDFLRALPGIGHEVRCYEDALALVAQARDRVQREDRVGKRFPEGIKSRAFEGLLKVSLYPYQREGALFAARTGRCILADDMGLGKTIQAIAGAEILAEAAGVERVLIVCPTSLKHQWKQEIERFAARPADVVEGGLAARHKAYANGSACKITNYDVLRRDLEAVRRWAPDLVILDEAQRIKNWRTRTAQTVKQLVSPFAFVLTGTPLENRLEELHSIVEFVDRFRLGPLFRFLDRHQDSDECGRVVGYRNLSEVGKTLEPILIRRKKEAVLRQLPERLDKHFFVPMTPQQQQIHDEARDVVAKIVAKWRRYHFLSDADQQRLRAALQTMRMSCNSTYLVDHSTDHGLKVGETMLLLDEIFEDAESKVVIFSQWLRTHELLDRELALRQWGHVLFHGGVPSPQRKDLIRRFRDDPDCRVFLSTDAGGVGLNLQHAHVVVNMDQPWNPAVLEQRIGRVHRLGQHRPVRVIHFVAQGTIEHGMLDVLRFKKSLFAGVLEGGQDEISLGGSRLKRFMESVEGVSTSIPTSMPTQDACDAAPGVEKEMVEAEEAVVAASAVPSPAQAPREDQPAPPWQECIAAGASLLDTLGKVLAASAMVGDASQGGGIGMLVERDERTRQAYVKFPVPSPEVVQQAAGALMKLVEAFSALTAKP